MKYEQTKPNIKLDKKKKKRKKKKTANKPQPQKVKKQQAKKQLQTIQENPTPNKRKKRKRHKRNYILHYIILTIIVVVTLTILSFTVFFNINSIQVLDSNNLSKEKIIELSNVKLGDNLLKISIEQIEKNIISNAINIDDVVVLREFPNRLSIKVVESQPKLAIKYKSDYYYLSEADRLIEKSPFNSHSELMLINGINLENIQVGDYFKINDKNNYDICKEILEAIKKSELSNINFINMSDLANVRVYYNNAIEIKLGNVANLDYKFKFAKEIINTKLSKDDQGVLDVQINGKSFFRQCEVKIEGK